MLRELWQWIMFIVILKNIEGFRADVKLGKQLGYTGKSVVHPNQIGVVHELYTPTIKEIESAKEILNAYEDALKKCFRGYFA